MKIKETWTTLKNKLKAYNIPKLLASRAFLVGGCVVLVAAAITVSVLVGNAVGAPRRERSPKAASSWATPCWWGISPIFPRRTPKAVLTP